MVSHHKGEAYDIIKDAWEQDAEIKYLDLKQEADQQNSGKNYEVYTYQSSLG